MAKLKYVLIILLILLTVTAGTASAAITMTINSGGDLTFGTKGDAGWQGGYRQLTSLTGYFNRALCQSTNGAVYFFRIRNLAPLTHTTKSEYTIDNSSFRWMSTYTSGAGQLKYATLVPFQSSYDTVYTSTANGDSGNQIEIQFIYDLTVTDAIAAGSYQTTIEYLMTE